MMPGELLLVRWRVPSIWIGAGLPPRERHPGDEDLMTHRQAKGYLGCGMVERVKRDLYRREPTLAERLGYDPSPAQERA